VPASLPAATHPTDAPIPVPLEFVGYWTVTWTRVVCAIAQCDMSRGMVPVVTTINADGSATYDSTVIHDRLGTATLTFYADPQRRRGYYLRKTHGMLPDNKPLDETRDYVHIVYKDGHTYIVEESVDTNPEKAAKMNEWLFKGSNVVTPEDVQAINAAPLENWSCRVPSATTMDCE
jgi:hypothetical protein